jgi:D-sedoheptulose 7-phosphate isomerase
MEAARLNYVKDELSKSAVVVQLMLADDALHSRVRDIGEACARAIANGPGTRFANGGKVMFCGNGGSAADSQHLAAELVGKLVFDRPGLPGLALTVDTSALTAVGNDFGYEQVFSRQVESLGRPGDVLVGISTSGSSRNVVRSFEVAKSRGIVTVAMTGAKAGPMSALADYWLPVPHSETQKIQEGHIMLGHIFCAIIEERTFGKTRTG